MKSGRLVLILGLAAVLVLGVGTCSTYNRLIGRGQAVDAQWAQVQNVYQRRADLVPNLVATVKGAAQFERETLEAVTQARSRVGQVTVPRAEAPTRPAELQQFQRAQDQLGGALSRLLVVAEAYPQLTATQGFRDLQAQLEGTENRIAVERMRYNEVARDFNTARFPASLVAGLFGDRFQQKPYFVAQAGSEQAPRVEF